MAPHDPTSNGAGVSPVLPGVPPAAEKASGRPLLAGLCCVLLLLAFSLCGCVSQTKANARARAAFLAGQQEAVARFQQAQGPSVTINGEVRNHVVSWKHGLTLAQAVVAADYIGAKDPGQIIIVHLGVAHRVDPKQLLSGVDIPLQPGDIVQIMPQAEPPKQ
jgi:hypothetical protein